MAKTKTKNAVTKTPGKELSRPAKKARAKVNKGSTIYHVDADFINKVRALAIDNATYTDCAIMLGMSPQNFGHIIRKHPAVQEAYDEGKAFHRVSLSRKLSQLAVQQNNVAAAIFLAKQSPENGGLGMSDRNELIGKGGGAIQIQFLPGDEKL